MKIKEAKKFLLFIFATIIITFVKSDNIELYPNETLETPEILENVGSKKSEEIEKLDNPESILINNFIIPF